MDMYNSVRVAFSLNSKRRHHNKQDVDDDIITLYIARFPEISPVVLYDTWTLIIPSFRIIKARGWTQS